jgi:glycosyltransferase involved in cell wall biosynthesis
MKPVKFSIVTIVYNGEELIEKTMQSVLNQTYTHCDYWVIDGKSKDSTLGIVEKTCLSSVSKISTRIVSEPDKGLYDAMNKGLRLVEPDTFTLFLNCGDQFLNNQVLEKLASKIDDQTDVIYGETILVNEARQHIGTRSAMTVQKLPEKLTWQSMRWGMVVCHQSFLVRKKPETPYYIDNNLAADIDWVIKCLKTARKTVNAQIPISEYLMGGISKKRHRQSLSDRFDVLKTHFGVVPNLMAHLWVVIRALGFKITHFNQKKY